MCLRKLRVFSVKTDGAILTTGLEGGSYRHIKRVKQSHYRPREALSVPGG
jgi:hypothetical protein